VAEELSEVLWAHKPPQFTTHADCEHVVLPGHVQFPVLCPACPRVNPIPATIKAINTTANFCIKFTNHLFLNGFTVQELSDTHEHMTIWF